MRCRPETTASTYYFSTDRSLVYTPFFEDFGPLNLACVWKYCKQVDDLLKKPVLSGRRLVHYCAEDYRMRANAAFLACAFQVAVMRKTAQQAWEPFEGVSPPFQPFRDAGMGEARFGLTILDCLEGLETSIVQGLFDWRRFDVGSYEHFDKVENGDITWIIPDRLLAFAGPFDNFQSHTNDLDWSRTPEEYASIFKAAGVGLVVRLNKAEYTREKFLQHGIKHVDLYFKDGSCPSPSIVSTFLKIVEGQPGPIAVHCKAGLGRTGTLIGMYAMKHHFFSARGFIGWCRLCRPGSVLGPQQEYLVAMQASMFQAGELLRGAMRPPRPSQKLLPGDTGARDGLDVASHMDAYLRYKDHGQGNRLVKMKKSRQGGRETTLQSPSTASTKASEGSLQEEPYSPGSTSSDLGASHRVKSREDSKRAQVSQVATAISRSVRHVFGRSSHTVAV